MRDNLEKRLAALEKRLAPDSGPIMLTMADGRVHRIDPPRRGGLLRLFAELMQGQHPEQAALIRDAVAYNEPGGGHMVNLIKAMLESPQWETRNEEIDIDASE